VEARKESRLIFEKSYRFVVELTPVSKKNSRPIFRNRKTGKTFLGKDDKLKQYENNAQLLLQAQCGVANLRKPLSGYLCAHFTFSFKEKCPMDGDNMLGAAQDVASSAGIIIDDKCLKHVELEVVENTGVPDRTIMLFGCCTRHQIKKVEDSTRGVPWNEAIQSLRRATKESQGGP
jgi:Holliday junction resolvase RusA-like endonuclease